MSFWFDVFEDLGTSLELVEFTKNGNEWEFKNLSEMVGISENGLQDIVDKYAA